MAIRLKELLRNRLTQPWETEVSEDWLHAFWILWPRSIILHGVMVSDMSMVSSDRSLKMEPKSRFLTIGWSTATHGKLKESISNTRFILEVK